MGAILLSVLVISGVAGMLALVIVVAGKYFANYGPCTIDINDGDRDFTIQGGQSLLSALVEQKIFIPSACGGRGTCGFCKCKINEGGGLLLPTETPFLSPEEVKNDIRLSCQVKVRNDIRIEIPKDILSVREYQCVCEKIEELTYDMRRFRFALQDPPTIDFTAGQYIQLLTPRYEGSNEEVYRAYSVASDPADKGHIDLIIRRVPNGICTTYCFDYLKEGMTVKLNGPYGDFGLAPTEAPMVFIAGGSGMAPFVSILHHMRNAGSQRQAAYFFGGNQIRDLCLQEQMAWFESELPNFRFIPVVAGANGERWEGERGLVTEAVARNFDDLSGHEGYLCGSPGMIDASIKVLVKHGMPEEKVYYDKFA